MQNIISTTLYQEDSDQEFTYQADNIELDEFDQYDPVTPSCVIRKRTSDLMVQLYELDLSITGSLKTPNYCVNEQNSSYSD